MTTKPVEKVEKCQPLITDCANNFIAKMNAICQGEDDDIDFTELSPGR